MSEVDIVRTLKRNRFDYVYDFVDDEYYATMVSIPRGVHVPNKKEAKMLRRIMAQTGLTKSEVRSRLVYRRKLAEAAKEQGSKTKLQRFGLRILKEILSELRLPKEHPAVKLAFIGAIAKRLDEFRYRLLLTEVSPIGLWSEVVTVS